MPALPRQTIQKHLKKSIISSLTPSKFPPIPGKNNSGSPFCVLPHFFFLKLKTHVPICIRICIFFWCWTWIILCMLAWQLAFYFSLIAPEIPADIWLDQLIFLHSCIIFHSWDRHHESNHSPIDWHPGCVQGICVCVLDISNDAAINMLVLLGLLLFL